MKGPLVGFALALLFSCCAGAPVRRLLIRWNVVDWPNRRSSHTIPTARGGGIAILAAIWLGNLCQSDLRGNAGILFLLAAATILAAASFIDDMRSLSALSRFALQAALSLSTLFCLGILDLRHAGIVSFGLPPGIVAALFFLWICGYTNAFNFMDGINGIAASQAIITGLGTGIIGRLALGAWHPAPVLLSFIIAGAALGFLPYNFPRPRMFMGDVGSAPLGFLLAALAVWIARDADYWSVFALLALHANFVLDTGITLARRIFTRQRWHEAHRDHFYQKLVRSGKSHFAVTGMEILIQVGVLAGVVACFHAPTWQKVTFGAVITFVWFAFFGFCEARFRQHSKHLAVTMPPFVD
jgi:UDP-N-acetylmuramyl pentapeptide phosphotransferase/UDP-N-acetylglucosamine-1-phosphate transferase